MKEIIKLLVRKAISLIRKISVISNNLIRKFIATYGNTGVFIAHGCLLGDQLKISCTDNGLLCIGTRTSIGDAVEITCRSGNIKIGTNVYIGKGSIFVSLDKIEVGSNTKFAEYCVMRDQDHALDTRPIRSAGFNISPIKIGKDCWLGTKVTVLRGSVIGDGAVIGAHSLVRGEIPPYTLAVGCPAKVVKHLPRQ